MTDPALDSCMALLLADDAAARAPLEAAWQAATARKALVGADLGLLTHARELALMQKLAEFPDLLKSAAHDLAPHDLAFYLRDLAGEFHSLYNERELRVLTAAEPVKMARLALYAATAQVIANALGLIGVSAPASM